MREAKDDSETEFQHDSGSETVESRSRETVAKVIDEETNPSAEHQWSKSQQEAHDDTQPGQDHSASSAQERPTDSLKNQHQRAAVCKKIFTTFSSLVGRKKAL